MDKIKTKTEKNTFNIYRAKVLEEKKNEKVVCLVFQLQQQESEERKKASRLNKFSKLWG